MIGRIIDNYEIRSLLGEGEVGAVYLCEHTFITRRVAVKVLHRQFCQDEAKVARFMAEARAANNLGHPEIAHIVDLGRLQQEVGQTEDSDAGLPYVMREWLDGETLAQRIGRLGKVPLYEATGIAKQACAALIAAHAAGIVHGDLKPENFLLGDALRGARLKLLDFGIVHLHPADAAIDARTDVRALGSILQAMLAGPSPNPDLPRWMERIIERALGLDPEARFETMAALAGALDDGPHVRVTAEARAAAAAGESGPAGAPAPLPGMTAATNAANGPASAHAVDAPAVDAEKVDATTPQLWAGADADDPRANMITPPPVVVTSFTGATRVGSGPALPDPYHRGGRGTLSGSRTSTPTTPAAAFAATAVAATLASTKTTAPRPTPTRPRKTLEELRRTLQQASSRRDTPAYPFLVPSPPPTPLPDPRAGGPFSQMLAPRRSRLKVVVGAALLLGAGYFWAPWSPHRPQSPASPPVATERAIAAPVVPPPPATAAAAPPERPTAASAPATRPAAAPKLTPAAAPSPAVSAEASPTRAGRNPPSISWEITPENALVRPARQPSAAKPADKPASVEKPARPDKSASAEKPARPDKPARTVDSEAALPSERPEKAARVEKPARPAPANPRAPGAPAPMDKW